MSRSQMIDESIRRNRQLADYYRSYLGEDRALGASDAHQALAALDSLVETLEELKPLRVLYDSANRLRLMTELPNDNEDRGQLIASAVVDVIEDMKACDKESTP